MTPDRRQRALSQVTLEARTELTPAIDWDAIEARLPMTHVETTPPRAPSWRPALLAAAFVLTAVALGLFVLSGRSATAPLAHAPAATLTTPDGEETTLDGNALSPGARISTDSAAQSVVHTGHVTWTLAPHSTATLLMRGEVVAIRLELGSVTSRVVKSSRIETFAVEAADVRVAAHGTEFVVSLAEDGVSVSVTEGSVLIGLRNEPGIGELLKSPASKRYTRSGKPIDPSKLSPGLDALRAGYVARAETAGEDPSAARNDPRSQPGGLAEGVNGAASKTRVASRATETQAATPEDPAALRPVEASEAALASATSGVTKITAACFRQRTAASDGVRVTAQTTLTFRTFPEGGVRSVVFEPPLSPWVQACVNAGVGGIQSEATRYGFQVSRTVDLERSSAAPKPSPSPTPSTNP